MTTVTSTSPLQHLSAEENRGKDKGNTDLSWKIRGLVLRYCILCTTRIKQMTLKPTSTCIYIICYKIIFLIFHQRSDLGHHCYLWLFFPCPHSPIPSWVLAIQLSGCLLSVLASPFWIRPHFSSLWVPWCTDMHTQLFLPGYISPIKVPELRLYQLITFAPFSILKSSMLCEQLPVTLLSLCHSFRLMLYYPLGLLRSLGRLLKAEY